MSDSTIGPQGRTTVPADIRARVGAAPGTRLVWSVTADGTIVVRAKTRPLHGVAGLPKAPEAKRIDVDGANPRR